MLELDHLVVPRPPSMRAQLRVYDQLGIAGAGRAACPHGHAQPGMRLGPGEYLEVIAVDPEASSPPMPAGSGLDRRFAGAPRITNWVLRTDALEDALAAAPEGAGVPVRLTRGEYHWARASSGEQPFDDCFPPLIEWHSPRPVDRMADLACVACAAGNRPSRGQGAA